MVLGSVFLAVTGAEALYADMGHFGALADPPAWLFLVLPCLAINYLGQGAMVLKAHGRRTAADAGPNWFFGMAPPSCAYWPLLILATAATRHRQPGGDHRRLLA